MRHVFKDKSKKMIGFILYGTDFYLINVNKAIRDGVPALVDVEEHRGAGLRFFDGKNFYTGRHSQNCLVLLSTL